MESKVALGSLSIADIAGSFSAFINGHVHPPDKERANLEDLVQLLVDIAARSQMLDLPLMIVTRADPDDWAYGISTPIAVDQVLSLVIARDPRTSNYSVMHESVPSQPYAVSRPGVGGVVILRFGSETERYLLRAEALQTHAADVSTVLTIECDDRHRRHPRLLVAGEDLRSAAGQFLESLGLSLDQGVEGSVLVTAFAAIAETTGILQLSKWALAYDGSSGFSPFYELGFPFHPQQPDLVFRLDLEPERMGIALRVGTEQCRVLLGSGGFAASMFCAEPCFCGDLDQVVGLFMRVIHRSVVPG